MKKLIKKKERIEKKNEKECKLNQYTKQLRYAKS